MQGSIWILDSECKRQSQPCNRPGFEDRLLHKLGKTYVLLVVTKGESRRGAAAGDVRQKGRREGRTYKEAKNACGSLGIFLIATQGSFSGMCKRQWQQKNWWMFRREKVQGSSGGRATTEGTSYAMDKERRRLSSGPEPDAANHSRQKLGG
ncbi:hypothetical protein DPV78_009750 [Talaromyces pinophilus]|nr:hypothetical protein DPV78_009750 [Talaromyces pinophilus]